MLYACIHLCMCICMCIHMCACACSGQRSALIVLPSSSPHYYWVRVSLHPELKGSERLASGALQAPSHLCLHSLRFHRCMVPHPLFICGPGTPGLLLIAQWALWSHLLSLHFVFWNKVFLCSLWWHWNECSSCLSSAVFISCFVFLNRES